MDVVEIAAVCGRCDFYSRATTNKQLPFWITFNFILLRDQQTIDHYTVANFTTTAKQQLDLVLYDSLLGSKTTKQLSELERERYTSYHLYISTMKKKDELDSLGGGDDGGEKRKRHAIRYTESDVNALIQLIPLHDGSADAILKIPPFDDGRYTKRQLYDKIRSLERDGRVLDSKHIHQSNNNNNNNIDDGYDENSNYSSNGADDHDDFGGDQDIAFDEKDDDDKLDNTKSMIHSSHGTRASSRAAVATIAAVFAGGDSTSSSTYSSDSSSPMSSPIRNHHNHQDEEIVQLQTATLSKKLGRIAKKASIHPSLLQLPHHHSNNNNNQQHNQQQPSQAYAPIPKSHQTTPKQQSLGPISPPFSRSKLSSPNPQSPSQSYSSSSSLLSANSMSTNSLSSGGGSSGGGHLRKIPSMSSSSNPTPCLPNNSNHHHIGQVTSPQNINTNQHINQFLQSSLLSRQGSISNLQQQIYSIGSGHPLGSPFYKLETSKYLIISMPIGPNETIKPIIDNSGNITLQITAPSPWGWLKERKPLDIIKEDVVRIAFFPHPGKPYSTPYRIQDIIDTYIGFIFEVGGEELTVNLSDIM
ncbi:hypothetical protein DFA_00280 [Cavenderia fasciculata]|uniref:Uncharacterized protein n=1 Tax=Cavenderia fasciculata TaxID=261658 RepID=F4PY42_CACFS|nr:uncharacterized protein DFA_00280 [Cavenderia fasciculata]EGG19702.1 hypothetical protein DFA_00280 [Cavenderia fasciculata]|eukprot:XP_004357996.1 hypothetical protein DFA_00280 [Cavenderia fasciculata]